MMNRYLLTLLLCLPFWLTAQPYYFSQGTATYAPLTDTISLNNGNVWAGFQSFTVPIGFSFQFMDSSFTAVDVEATGRLIFDNPSHYYFADLLVVNGFRDRGFSSGTSISPLSYKLDTSGGAGDYILKIEFQNVGMSTSSSYSTNFQLWLYEVDNSLELHQGPVFAPSLPNAPISGVHQVNTYTPAIVYDYALSLYGNATNPSDTTYTTNETHTLNGLPSNGTVFRYSPVSPFTALNKLKPIQTLSIIPNPATDQIILDLPLGGAQVKVYNLQGQVLYQQAFREAGNVSIGLNELSMPAGVYIVALKKGARPLSLGRFVKLK